MIKKLNIFSRFRIKINNNNLEIININNIDLLYPKKMIFDNLTNQILCFTNRVRDGDTIIIEDTIFNKLNLHQIRLIGVDTPESVSTHIKPQFFGKEQSNFTHKQLENKIVYLTFDKNVQDRYGRLVAFVWIKINNKFYLFNLLLVQNGFGRYLSFFKFNKQYMKIFKKQEQFQKQHKLRMWSN